VKDISELIIQNRQLLNKIQQQEERIQQQEERIQQQEERIQQQVKHIDELVNTVAVLKEENQQLKDEIAILKGQKPRPKIPPSNLEGPKSKNKEKDKSKTSRGKHPRRKKTNKLKIHNRQRIKPENIPEGAVFKGCQKYTVQDIVLAPSNTVYELERWQLPDGTYLTGELPLDIQGHYGPQLTAYVLHQYYGCRITAPLLLAQLKELGVLISAGQLSRIIIEGKEAFHAEKNDLLLAGILATSQIQVDDTGARHQGKNGYSTIIGNQFFTTVVTTESKSRINFLTVLHGNNPLYLINEDAEDYIRSLKPSHWLPGYLHIHATDQAMSQDEWNNYLFKIGITTEGDVKLVTEAALLASLIEKGIPKNLGVHGDDAGQFNAFVRSLCWIHEERHYRKLIPANDEMRQAIESVRDEIWKFYRGLKEYQEMPSEEQREALENSFESLFTQTTISSILNKRLAKTYAKKEELLRVLERPETPLHNNRTETDAREVVVKRKVSGGTRSDEGKKCRDTFISLKKTCVKLGINFLSYLKDRVSGQFEIPRLSEVIAAHANIQPKGP